LSAASTGTSRVIRSMSSATRASRSETLSLGSSFSALELDDGRSVSDDTKAVVAAYNDDDCRSTEALSDWLERLRADAIASGIVIDRPSAEK
ncbi:hypothetical protein ACC743_38370, partial [Rhizobium ruizarguesonis]